MTGNELGTLRFRAQVASHYATRVLTFSAAIRRLCKKFFMVSKLCISGVFRALSNFYGGPFFAKNHGLLSQVYMNTSSGNSSGAGGRVHSQITNPVSVLCPFPFSTEKMGTITYLQPWELGKKCDGNLILIFAVVKVRHDGITTANIFVKICLW